MVMVVAPETVVTPKLRGEGTPSSPLQVALVARRLIQGFPEGTFCPTSGATID